MSNPNIYKILSKRAFKKAIIEKKEPSVLVFGAEWSGNSEIMDSMMERISQEFNSNILFFKVDIELHPEVATFFGITNIPTTIMLKEGEVLHFIRGFISTNQMRKKIRSIYSNFIED